MLKSNQLNTNQQQAILSKFDIIGSYFVYLYYNELYNKAKQINIINPNTDLTESYKNILSSYLEFSKSNDFLNQIIKNINIYINNHNMVVISPNECIDILLIEFVPKNLWDTLREDKKKQLFHKTIINCITIFTERIINNHLKMIIDYRNNVENVIILQDLFLNILLEEKDLVFSKFINPGNDSINLDILKKKLQNFVNDKSNYIKQNNILKTKIECLENLNIKNANIIKQLQKLNLSLINELSVYKENKKFEIKPEVKEEFKPEIKEEFKPEIKEEFKPEVKEEIKPEVKEEIKFEIKEEIKEKFKPEVKEEEKIEEIKEEEVKEDKYKFISIKKNKKNQINDLNDFLGIENNIISDLEFDSSANNIIYGLN